MHESLEELRTELEQRVEAAYPGEGRIVVHGEGCVGARVMLIGEAPGETETRLCRPFVGKAGKNLDEFLELAGLDREQLYVSNTVKFRPTKRSAAGNIVNRPPDKSEIELFLPYLLREISIVRPEVVVTLGNVPLRAVYNSRACVGGTHGQMIDCGAYRLFSMYHPASVIYNRSLRDIYISDIHRLAEYLT